MKKKLKIDNLDTDSLAAARKLFEQEARILYALGTHPNIAALLAHFEDTGEFYLVQKLISRGRQSFTVRRDFTEECGEYGKLYERVGYDAR